MLRLVYYLFYFLIPLTGLTAKVFRTYNASKTLQNQLDLLTDADASVAEKLLAYNRANRAVAILCNHQRSVPKGHQKSMENLKEKIRAKRDAIDECEAEYHVSEEQINCPLEITLNITGECHPQIGSEKGGQAWFR